MTNPVCHTPPRGVPWLVFCVNLLRPEVAMTQGRVKRSSRTTTVGQAVGPRRWRLAKAPPPKCSSRPLGRGGGTMRTEPGNPRALSGSGRGCPRQGSRGGLEAPPSEGSPRLPSRVCLSPGTEATDSISSAPSVAAAGLPGRLWGLGTHLHWPWGRTLPFGTGPPVSSFPFSPQRLIQNRGGL